MNDFIITEEVNVTIENMNTMWKDKKFPAKNR